MNFRLKICVVMVVFAIVISFTMATVDYLRFKDQVIEHNQFQVEQIEETVKYSLKTIEKAYFLFGEDLATKMEAASDFVIEWYQENPNLDEWDFQKLKDALNFDIYMINEKNVITHSSLSSDLGLDFTVCCKKLVPILEKRRASGEFFADGMDIEQHTGVIKKYSYMATSDKKYLIQLGVSLEDGRIFKEFNFLKTIEELVQRYPSVNEINVLNIGGYSLGEPVVDEKKLPEARKKDILFRWGGDEFAVVMPDTSKIEAEQAARGIIENLQDLCAQRDLQFDGKKISVSIGIALAPEDGVDPESLHKHADLALYHSKEKGKNQYQFYSRAQ